MPPFSRRLERELYARLARTIPHCLVGVALASVVWGAYTIGPYISAAPTSSAWQPRAIALTVSSGYVIGYGIWALRKYRASRGGPLDLGQPGILSAERRSRRQRLIWPVTLSVCTFAIMAGGIVKLFLHRSGSGAYVLLISGCLAAEALMLFISTRRNVM